MLIFNNKLNILLFDLNKLSFKSCWSILKMIFDIKNQESLAKLNLFMVLHMDPEPHFEYTLFTLSFRFWQMKKVWHSRRKNYRKWSISPYTHHAPSSGSRAFVLRWNQSFGQISFWVSVCGDFEVETVIVVLVYL